MSRGRRTLILAGLVAAVLAAHLGALGGTFHYDDTFAIVENPNIRVWQPLVYLTSPMAGSSWSDGSAYRPLTVATFAMNYAWGRLAPGGYLAVNLILHLFVSWMVFVLGRHLLKSERWALVAAVIFALHPVNAEAVNYIVARSSLLSTAGAVVAFWAFLRWWEGDGRDWLVLGLASFAAALLSKESGIAVVLPLMAYALIFRRIEGGPAGGGFFAIRRVWAVMPFIIVAVAYLIVLRRVGGGQVISEGGAVYPIWAFVEMTGRALLLWVWPFPLGLDHPLVFVSRFDPVVAALLVAAGACAAVVMWAFRRRDPFVSWVLIWIVAGFLPLLPLPWITTRGLLQENRLAFSAVGLAWLSAAAIRAGWGLVIRRMPEFRAATWIGLTSAVALLIIAVGMDRWRSTVWHDDRLVWEEVARNAPGYPIAHLNLGATYLESGDYDRAESAFRRVLSLDPDHATAHYNLGLLTMRRAQYQESRTFFQQAIALNPGYAKAYRALGTLEMESGHPEAAVAAFKQAVVLNPRDAMTYAQFGLLAQRAGRSETAEGAYRAALRYDPDNPEVHNALGMLYLDRQRWAEAFEQFTAAVRGNPNSLEAAYNQAVALYRLGRLADARAAVGALLPRIPPGPKFESYRRAAQAMLRAEVTGGQAQDSLGANPERSEGPR